MKRNDMGWYDEQRMRLRVCRGACFRLACCLNQDAVSGADMDDGCAAVS